MDAKESFHIVSPDNGLDYVPVRDKVIEKNGKYISGDRVSGAKCRIENDDLAEKLKNLEKYGSYTDDPEVIKKIIKPAVIKIACLIKK